LRQKKLVNKRLAPSLNLKVRLTSEAKAGLGAIVLQEQDILHAKLRLFREEKKVGGVSRQRRQPALSANETLHGRHLKQIK
jgi:hypothetical protein